MLIVTLFSIFLIIILGFVLKKINFINDTSLRIVEKLTYFIFFPALLIFKLNSITIELNQIKSIIIICFTLIIAMAFILYILRKWLAFKPKVFTSFFQGSLRYNSIIAFACAYELYGNTGLLIATVISAIKIPLVNFLVIFCFSYELRQNKIKIGEIIYPIFKNPLIVACITGITLNIINITLPNFLLTFLDLLSQPALPLGLIAVGAGVQLNHLKNSKASIITSSLIKLVLMPTFIFILSIYFELDLISLKVLILCFAVPTASSAYILSRQLGGDSQLMANIISFQTLLSFLTLWLWLIIVDSLILKL